MSRIQPVDPVNTQPRRDRARHLQYCPGKKGCPNVPTALRQKRSTLLEYSVFVAVHAITNSLMKKVEDVVSALANGMISMMGKETIT